HDEAVDAISEAVARSLGIIVEEGAPGVGASASAAANAVSWESRWPDGIWVAHDAGEIAEENEGAAQADLLHDLVGNPFRPVALDPVWLAANDSRVKRLAQGIYDTRDFSAMPILADALEDAGCADAALLGHLRGPGPHVHGCWALDAILGKE